MPLPTEVFVMVVFMAGLPFFYFILRGSDLPGRLFFMLVYALLTCSNICTVAEKFWLSTLFSACEDLLVALSSVFMLAAVLKFTTKT